MASLAARLQGLDAKGKAKAVAGACVCVAAAVALAKYVSGGEGQKRNVEGEEGPRRTDSRSSLSLSAKAQLEKKLKEEKERRKKGAINKEFYRELRKLVKIVIPSVYSKEMLILFLHTLSLILRTFLSIRVASLDGAIVKSIVDRSPREFAWNICKWLALAIPATYTNSMIRFLESKLAIAFRTKLTLHLYGLYMDNETYYRVENLDSRLNNADQCLTEDVSKFCQTLAHLHSQISKPLLDVVIMSVTLMSLSAESYHGQKRSLMSKLAPILMAAGTTWVTVRVLKFVSPPFGRMIAEQAALEGEFRYAHSRLITNAEEVAFYGGHEIERGLLEKCYLRLVKHMNDIYRKRILYNTMEGFLMKYVWSAVGLTMVAIPAFSNQEHDVSTRTQGFVTARGLLVNAADAVERIMSSYKEVTELAGYTSRVSEMLRVFDEVKDGKFEKTAINTAGLPSGEEAGGQLVPAVNILQQRGDVSNGDGISFSDVPIVSPNGDVLVKSLSCAVEPGMHLLITGPNGCGKSSLFRILGGLWPVCGGKVMKPRKSSLFYIPQRPYLCLGTLRDQITYPDTAADLARKGKDDSDLEEIMGWVHLKHIVEREGGWDSVNDWQDVLSGGEKQRVGMARLLYHRPTYAILDECTSAVSIDVEGKMYLKAKELGITLITVTHRPSLWKYHEHLLQFDGEGGWSFSPLNAESRLSLKEEKMSLEAQLNGVPGMQRRLKELCALLGEDSILIEDSDDEEEQTTDTEQQ